uniref:Uncharacterized protein n=1 Tax=Eptatretus burgeri TaxID=7764 RepID=A0A8C4QS86_EPTBU
MPYSFEDEPMLKNGVVTQSYTTPVGSGDMVYRRGKDDSDALFQLYNTHKKQDGTGKSKRGRKSTPKSAPPYLPGPSVIKPAQQPEVRPVAKAKDERPSFPCLNPPSVGHDTREDFVGGGIVGGGVGGIGGAGIGGSITANSGPVPTLAENSPKAPEFPAFPLTASVPLGTTMAASLVHLNRLVNQMVPPPIPYGAGPYPGAPAGFPLGPPTVAAAAAENGYAGPPAPPSQQTLYMHQQQLNSFAGYYQGLYGYGNPLYQSNQKDLQTQNFMDSSNCFSNEMLKQYQDRQSTCRDENTAGRFAGVLGQGRDWLHGGEIPPERDLHSSFGKIPEVPPGVAPMSREQQLGYFTPQGKVQGTDMKSGWLENDLLTPSMFGF